MSYRVPGIPVIVAAILAFAVLTSTRASAQISPGGMGGPGGPGMGGAPTGAGSNDEKKEGVGIEAPKSGGMLPTTPALPAPKSPRKQWTVCSR